MTLKEYNEMVYEQIILELNEIPEEESLEFLIYISAYSKIRNLISKLE